jgi:hypothetical protein
MTTPTTRPSISTLSRSAGRFSISLLSDVKQVLTSSTPTSLLGSYCKVDTSGLDNTIASTSLGDLARSRQRHSPVAQPSHSPRSGTRRALGSAARRSPELAIRHARELGALPTAPHADWFAPIGLRRQSPGLIIAGRQSPGLIIIGLRNSPLAMLGDSPVAVLRGSPLAALRGLSLAALAD